MKVVGLRFDSEMVSLIDTLKRKGYGLSVTDVVRRAVVFAANATPGEVADAWATHLEELQVVPEPVTPAATVPGCEECGAPFAPGNSRFCPAHMPSIDGAM